MKRADNAVFDTVFDSISGTFTSGTTLHNLEVDGVGLAAFHKVDPFVPQSVRDALNSVEQGIINGIIDINNSFQNYIIYLWPLGNSAIPNKRCEVAIRKKETGKSHNYFPMKTNLDHTSL